MSFINNVSNNPNPVVWDPDHPGTFKSVLSLEPRDVSSHMSQNERREASTKDPQLSLKNKTITKKTKDRFKECLQSRIIKQYACTHFPVEPSSSFEGNLYSSQLPTELMQPELDLHYVFMEVLSTLKQGKPLNPRLQQQVWSIKDDASADLMLLISELASNTIFPIIGQQRDFFAALCNKAQRDLLGRKIKNQLAEEQLDRLNKLTLKIFSNDSHSG